MDKIIKRFKNPVFVTAILTGALLMLKGFGVISFSEDIDRVVSAVITAGVALGIWVDPTTPGISDK